MKMKRFFTNKISKKKKVEDNSASIYDSKQLEPTEKLALSSQNTNESRKTSETNKYTKKKRQRKSKKIKEAKATDDQSVCPVLEEGVVCAYSDSNGTKVVLRRASGCAQLNGSTLPNNHHENDKHIPGSESSSRTASSVSSSSTASSLIRSTRRPWSVVDPIWGPSATESNDDDSDIPSPKNSFITSDRLNSSAPANAICTLPRGAALEESFGSNQNRNRSFFIDFNFFKRFRRSATPNTVNDHKKLRDSPSIPSEDTNASRGSFRMKKLGKKKKGKNWQDVVTSSSCAKSSTLSPPEYEILGKRLLVSGSDSSSGATEGSVPEEKVSVDEKQSRISSSRSSMSCGSTNTIVSISEPPNMKGVERVAGRSSSIPGGACLPDSSRDVLQAASSGLALKCEKCHELRRDGKQSNCNDDFSSSKTDVRYPPLYKDSRAFSAGGNRTHCTSAGSDPSRNARISESLCDLRDGRSASLNAEDRLGSTATIGGSVQSLPTHANHIAKFLIASTLPRGIVGDSRFCLQSPQRDIVYSSSPQLNSPRFAVPNARKMQKERPKSTMVQFEDPHLVPVDIRLKPRVSISIPGEMNNALVDSPVKRVVGYPGVVVMRRRQKKTNAEDLVKSPSSYDLSSRSSRAKQVMSLNVEDLPTYSRMLKELRWSNASTNSSDNGPVRVRAEILFNRFISYCTSEEEIRCVKHWFERNSIEELNNLDDDEFLNLYLSPPPINGAFLSADSTLQIQEPATKKVKNLKKSVASFANLFSPGKPSRDKLQRSSSFKESMGYVSKPYRPPGSQNNGGNNTSSGGSNVIPGKRGCNKNAAKNNRRSRLWCETFDHSGLDVDEIKRQEAIFELYQGERVMVDDLKMAKQTYRDSMVTLKMLTEDEVTRIFGKLDCLLPLHEDLLSRLERDRTKDGRTEGVAHVFIDWFPTLLPYDEYCANQSDAKETLDAVISREARVRDFLQRCLESPFSRKLDLWSYLDLPRSRLVKYPLLLRAILKVTPQDHADATLLEKAITVINGIITRVDDLTGERQAKFVQSKLEYIDDKQKCPEVDRSRKVLCSGQLKNSRGSKLQVYLFDLALVLTRNATRGDKLTYQVYRQPLPLHSITVETDEGGKLSGSFRSGLLSSDKVKHSFRVKSEELNISYTLIATDEHNKKLWINSLQEAVNNCRLAALKSAGNQSPFCHRSSSDKVAEKHITVKRSASVKSESGSSSPWFRHRSLTVNGQLSRKNSKDKLSTDDLKKKSRMSPLPLRRNSKSGRQEFSKKLDFLDVSPDERSILEERSSYSRSRSLTSSPIAFLAHLQRRSRERNGSGLARSESCFSKPPSGRVSALSRYRSASHTPPRSPKLPSTRSAQDLSKYAELEEESLEDVKKRLSSGVKLSEKVSELPIIVSCAQSSSSSAAGLPPLHKHLSTVSHFTVDSPYLPAASCTSQNFPIVEEETLSPKFKSLAPNPASSPAASLPPTIAWPPSNSVSDLSGIKPISESSRSSSSESLQDVNPLDDVTTMLENVGRDEICRDDDVTPTNEMTKMDSREEISDVLNELVSRVCERERDFAHSSRDVPSANRDSCIKLISGLPWRENEFEMVV